MTSAVGLAAALCAGFTLGFFFFGGLWWTVRRGLTSKWAGLWFSGSFVLRTAIVVTGFYLAAQGDWRRMAFCGVGFLGGRFFVGWLTRSREAKPREGTP